MARGVRLDWGEPAEVPVSARGSSPLLFPLVAALLTACAQGVAVPTGSNGEPDAGPPADAGPGEDADPGLAEDTTPPTVAITTPADGEALSTETVRIEGTANDDVGVASVRVQVGPNVAVLAETSDGFRHWAIELPIPYGSFVIEATAVDTRGRVSPEPARVRVSRPAPGPDGRGPTVTITAPEDGSSPRGAVVLVEGSAEDDVAVVRMELERNGEVLEERRIETDDFFARWARLTPLLPGEMNVLTFRAWDEVGNVGEATLRLTGRPEVDRDPPLLEVTSHASGDTFSAETLALAGTTSDRLGVREVKVRLLEGASGVLSGDAVFAQTTDGYANWTAELPVPSGPLSVEVKAIDVSGLATEVVLDLENTLVSEWGEERVMPLFIREQPASELLLELDREGVNEVIHPSIQQDLVLLDLDPNPLLTNALDRIKTACGTRWQENSSDPRHDCSLTALGRTFVGPDGTWRTSPEYSLVRLLTMTPANVEVEGTSIEGLKDLADNWGIGGGFSQILSDVLGIPLTTEIVGTGPVVNALRTGFVNPHPNTTASGEIPVTLYDAMNDLAPLGPRLGPASGHPGLLDPSSPTRSVVFGPGFQMNVVALSNLKWLDGVDLSDGKDYMATIVDTTGPTYEDVVEFDFTDPSRFEVEGLTPSPSVDFRFRVQENDAFIPSCNGSSSCKNNLPGMPLDTSYVWSTPTWELEHLVTLGAFDRYRDRRFRKCYVSFIGCQGNVQVGWDGEPAGWIEFYILFNLGNPPEDQYVWELISEVGQVALHRLPSGSLAEGDADVAFTLEDVPVGITADEIREAVRPVLQAQASTLSDRLLGDYARNNGNVDFFYRRGRDGIPTLFFAAPEDPRPSGTYDFANPGFFSDPELATKVSQTNIPGSGDTTHEKVRLSPGETTLYVQDESGTVYRLRFDVPSGDASEITVRIARRR